MEISMAVFFKLIGRVFSGLGYASRFVKIYEDLFIKYLNFNPYPGTLNVDIGCDASLLFLRLKPIIIPPPIPIYSYVYVYPASINNSLKVYVVKSSRSIYDWRVLEIVSKTCLRELLGLKDGDYVEIVVEDSTYN
ncbi:MAG: DUF120 domain-containing protein [Desulfurococcaceae archaeon]|uniref:Riboflavin kinase n=1 Tax=Staphylothermus marinus TaxID=2280 RepID=A0A7C4H9V0_STAMA